MFLLLLTVRKLNWIPDTVESISTINVNLKTLENGLHLFLPGTGLDKITDFAPSLPFKVIVLLDGCCCPARGLAAGDNAVAYTCAGIKCCWAVGVPKAITVPAALGGPPPIITVLTEPVSDDTTPVERTFRPRGFKLFLL